MNWSAILNGVWWPQEQEGVLPPPPLCPDKVFVLQVCNANASRDDNFDLYLNNQFIGALDLNQNAQVGSIFIGSTDTNKVITQPDFICPLNNMAVYYFNPLILTTGLNTIFMDNTQNNGNGNAGTIQMRNYEIDPTDPNALINPCVVSDQDFSPSPGGDWNAEFNYTECCPD
jgi:hypothetical protein